MVVATDRMDIVTDLMVSDLCVFNFFVGPRNFIGTVSIPIIVLK